MTGRLIGDQILPVMVFFFDALDFLFPAPSFELFFAGDGIVGVVEGFVVDKDVDVIAFGEAGKPQGQTTYF